ncbi:condensation domain-containing protein [Streptomyces sp. NPDC126514]|uniref:condensation domain-containing protein n=1 Tax=Streptomyces sp. NPDC126514 TaxID=3155210 RepID=UPI00332486AC
MTTRRPTDASALKTAPLAAGQHRMWFSEQLNPGSGAYVIQRALHVSGPLDLTALRRAVAFMVRRHDVLRTVYRETGSGVEQVVLTETPEVFHVSERRANRQGGSAVPSADIDGWIQQRRAQPFDLRTGPVLRFDVLPASSDDHILLLTVHHIAFDGWSMRMFFQELSTAYDAYVREGRGPALTPAPSHLDFALSRSADPEPPAAHLAYWTYELNGAPSALELPYDFPPGLRTTGAAHVTTFDLPADAVTRMGKLALHHRCTPFMAMLACYAAMLCGYGETREVMIAAPVAERFDSDEAAQLMGFLVNLVPLRISCLPGDTMPSLLKRTRETCLNAAEFPVPFERAVALSKVPRLPYRTPLAQAAFDLHRPAPLPSLSGLDVAERPIRAVTTRFGIELHLEHHRDASQGTLLVSADLFHRDAADVLAETFTSLVTAWPAAPHMPLHTVAWNNDTEERH